MDQQLTDVGRFPAYEPGPGFDEAFSAPEVARAHYVASLEALAASDLAGIAAAIARDVTECGMSFRTAEGSQAFHVDPVPRVIDAPEWRLLERGLAQRAQALNAFLEDAYGERLAVDAGVVPERVLDGAEMFEPDLRGVPLAGGVHAGVAGFDVVRDATGEFEVLEDNLRTPSGLAYVGAARDVVSRRLPVPPSRAPLRTGELLKRTLVAAAPEGRQEPSIVLLSDGPTNSAHWEHRQLARALGVPLVMPRDVVQRAGRIWARGDGGHPFPVDVVYRRTDEDRVRGDDGVLTWLGELLLEPLRRGAVACVNAFGNGLADDKLVHAYVEDMVRFYLGEEPLVRSVHTYDPGEPSVRQEVLDRIGELVVKPRNGSGGAGVVVCPHASPADVEEAARLVRTRPEAVVVQDTIELSTHPTVVDGALEPRHVDLRPFVFSTPSEASVLAGGLTRVALGRGALVVNSSMNGGGKDTWMLT